MKTPWGKSYGSKIIIPGMRAVYTAGHGGYRLMPALNARVPAKWRLDGEFEGWYEEDCGWAPLAATFPEAFPGVDPDMLERNLEWWESWVGEMKR